MKVFVHSSSAVIFSPGTNFLSQPNPTVIRRPRFQQDETSSPRSPSSQKPSYVQLVPACVASRNNDNAVSRDLDKNRVKHRRTVFSMKMPKRASSDQRTDEEDTSETCNNNHVSGRAVTYAQKRNRGWTYIYTSLVTGMAVFAMYLYVPWQ